MSTKQQGLKMHTITMSIEEIEKAKQVFRDYCMSDDAIVYDDKHIYLQVMNDYVKVKNLKIMVVQ